MVARSTGRPKWNLEQRHSLTSKYVRRRLVFDAFGDHGLVEPMGEVDDRLGNVPIGLVLAQMRHKTAIDLDLIDR